MAQVEKIERLGILTSNRLFTQIQLEIETQHFEARKRLFKYDSLIHLHRMATYQYRQELLELDHVSMVSILDHYWLEYLDQIEKLKESLSLVGYAQKDPFTVFRYEASYLYEQMKINFREAIEHQYPQKLAS